MKIYKHKGQDSRDVLIVGHISNLQNIAFCQFIKTDICHWLSFSSGGNPWIFFFRTFPEKRVLCYPNQPDYLHLEIEFRAESSRKEHSWRDLIPIEHSRKDFHLLLLPISLDHHWLLSFLRPGYSIFPLILQDSLAST